MSECAHNDEIGRKNSTINTVTVTGTEQRQLPETFTRMKAAIVIVLY